MSKADIIKILKKAYPVLSRRFNVKRIALFGSLAKGTQTDSSDVDLMIEFNGPIGLKFVELGEFLEGLLGTRVDILTRAGINAIRVKRAAKAIERNLEYV
jgi:predicted nucleotidyltransferase